MRESRLQAILPVAAGAILVALHYLVFSRFFPNENGHLGHDYAYFLTQLLDGFFWYNANGLLAVPWFTPSFCGGLPKFANPQALYYSVPQFLSFLTDPLTSVRLTLLAFSAFGFWGFYLLQRRIFSLSRSTALLGGTLFLFNTLYSSRMLIGHLTFHSFMLGPLIWFLLLRPLEPGTASPRWRFCFDVACAALLIAYVASTALPHVLFPILVVALLAALLQDLLRCDGFRARIFAAKFALSSLLALSLCSAKLVAAQSFLNHFPRTLYPLPGVSSLFDLAHLTLRSVFFSTPDALVREVVVNSRWQLAHHEFEYGITALPLGLLIAGAVLQLYRLRSTRPQRGLRRGQWVALLGACALLVLPLALNYYTPAWNGLLKSLPIIGNSSVLFRWFSIYVPIAILLATVTLERSPVLREYRSSIASIGIATVIAFNLFADRSYYQRQAYDPGPVLEAYEETRSASWSPAIARIAVHRDASGREFLAEGRNDVLVRGESQLLCYETLFGFRLESFPRGALKEGPTLELRDGFFNIKDPSCYLFPEENGCSPGDHFAANRRDEAGAFAHYRRFRFAMSRRQQLANVVSLTSLAITLAFLTAFGLRHSASWQGWFRR